MATDILDFNSIIDYLYDPFTELEDTIEIGSGSLDPERRTIPSLPPYQVKLFFAPQQNSPSTTFIEIVGGSNLIEVPKTQTPANLQFRINYDEKGIGIAEFNENQKGNIIDITYKATATTIQKQLFTSFQNKILADIDEKFQETLSPFTDGLSWVTRNLDTTGFDGSVNHIAYDSNLKKWIAVGILTTYLKIWTSENLKDWTEVLSVNKGAMTYGFKRIVYSEDLGIWVAIGDYIYTSYNLEDWTERIIPVESPGGIDLFLDYANDCIWIEDLGVFIACGVANRLEAYSYALLKSSDGITWTYMTIPIPTVAFGIRSLFFIRYDNGYIYTGGDCVNRAELFYSADAINWNKIEIATHTSHKDALYSESMFLWVVIGDEGKIATASGANIAVWTNRASGVVTDLQKIAKTESSIIVAGADKTILVSSNGTSYTNYSLLGTDVWAVKDIIFENEILLIVTDDNRLVYSNDITTFTEIDADTPLTVGFLGIVYINGIFLLFGDSGYIGTNGLFFWSLSDSQFALSETEYNNINTRLTTIESYPMFSEILGLTNAVDAVKNGTDTEHDIDIVAGIKCWDSTFAEYMGISSAMTKRIDAAWAVGTGNGGMFTGAVGANTTYHFFMIKKDSDGSLDYGWDTSLIAANKPAGYTYYRRLWSHITNASNNIINFTQKGKKCTWKVRILDYNSVPPNTNRQTVPLTVPNGLSVEAEIQAVLAANTTTNFYVIFTGEGETDTAPTNLNSDLFSKNFASIVLGSYVGFLNTTTSKQIYYRINDITGVYDLNIHTKSYKDFTL